MKIVGSEVGAMSVDEIGIAVSEGVTETLLGEMGVTVSRDASELLLDKMEVVVSGEVGELSLKLAKIKGSDVAEVSLHKTDVAVSDGGIIEVLL